MKKELCFNTVAKFFAIIPFLALVMYVSSCSREPEPESRIEDIEELMTQENGSGTMEEDADDVMAETDATTMTEDTDDAMAKTDTMTMTEDADDVMAKTDTMTMTEDTDDAMAKTDTMTMTEDTGDMESVAETSTLDEKEKMLSEEAKPEESKAESSKALRARGGETRMRTMVVTATKRDSNPQDVPFSVNVQSGADIERLGISNLEELAGNVAGFSIQNLGPGQSVVNIRGVSSGQIVRDQPGVKEQVGVYLDETPVSLSLFNPDLDLFDLNRVETLRGPQGTLFGSGSIGGTVRYITNQPKLNVTEMKTEIDFNTIDGGSSGGHQKQLVNVPLMEDVAALRVVAYATQYPGFIDALREPTGTDKDVNDGKRYGGRISLLFKPLENLSITPRVVYQNIDMNGFNRDEIYNLYANPFTTTRPAVRLGERQQKLLRDEAFEDETLIMDTTVKWQLEDLFDVSYTASYINRDMLVSRDASALTGSVSVDLGFPEAGVLLPSNLRDTTDLSQMTHELHFKSNNESSLKWLVGMFYSDTDRDYAQRLPTPGYDSFLDDTQGAGTSAGASNGFPDTDSPYVSDLTYDLREIALFGESTLTVLDGLNLTAGLRWYDWEEDRTFKSGGFFSTRVTRTDETESDGFSPRFIVDVEVTEQTSVSAQASKGFRLGGASDPLNENLCSPGDVETYGEFQKYDDETLWNYELGIKSSFESLQFNAAVFYTDITDLQVNLDAGGCSSRVSVNVPEAHTLGTELELYTNLTESLLLSFSGSYIQAEFDSTVRNTSGDIIGGIEKGNRLASVPDWQLSAAATYTFPGVLLADDAYLTATWQYIGEQITQPSDQLPDAGVITHGLAGFGGMTGEEISKLDLTLGPYYLVNLSAGLIYEHLEFMLYVKNVMDKNVRLSYDRERGGRARRSYRVGQPRTIGVVARMTF